MSKIRIKNLRLQTIIGIYPHERKQTQKIIINIQLECDTSKAEKSDQIEDTVDYHTLTEKISKKVKKSDFQLLEKLADYIADICLQDSRVEKVKIEIDKPQALEDADSVSIILKKVRDKQKQARER